MFNNPEKKKLKKQCINWQNIISFALPNDIEASVEDIWTPLADSCKLEDLISNRLFDWEM